MNGPTGRTPRQSSAARSSAGDPVRTLKLLWRNTKEPRATRGPKQRTSVDAVVDAAIRIADRDGLGAATIRAVAAELGITPMATYTYVPGKAELLDLMLDAVYQRMERHEIAELPWRERVSTIARENRDMLAAHPWVVALATTRPTLGPGVAAKYDHELSAFDGVGLTDLEMDSALTYVLGFVASVARIDVDTRAATADSGIDDHTWWQQAAPLLASVFDQQRFPLAARVGAVAGETHDSAYSAAHAFEFGIARVLDGLAPLIERPAPARPSPPGLATS